MKKQSVPTFDKDGYPTVNTLRKIEKWKIKDHVDLISLFEFIKNGWWSPDWGFHHEVQKVNIIYGNAICKVQHNYQLSTGGWSGNEDIIASMKKNRVFWSMTWQVHRIGGHYDFKVEELKFTKP